MERISQNTVKIAAKISTVMEKYAVKICLAAISWALIFCASATEAKAFTLDAPTMSTTEVNNYDGVKIFINGRLVEFNDSLGYPYIENGRTMIPLRAVAETFNAYVAYNSPVRMAYVSKNQKTVSVTIDENKIKFTNENNIDSTIQIDSKAVIRNNRTYIPLRSVFECFGLNARWDAIARTAHIETLGDNPFPYIDFKDKKIISIKDIDLSSINKVIYDGKEVSKDYVNILKNSDQYKVFIEDKTANIFSYQFLSDLNYLYGKEKKYMSTYSDNRIVLRPIDDKTKAFYDQLHEILGYAYLDTAIENESDLIGKSVSIKSSISESDYKEVSEALNSIVNKVRTAGVSKREQVIMVNQILSDLISYDKSPSYRGHDSVYNGLVEHLTVCQGYSACFKLIMDKLGIPCINVFGHLNKVSFDTAHMWNQVYVDGKWLLVDVTLNDSVDADLSLIGRDINNVFAPNQYLLKSKFDDHIVNNSYDESSELIKLTYKFD